jgi:hypothetical protein
MPNAARTGWALGKTDMPDITQRYFAYNRPSRKVRTRVLSAGWVVVVQRDGLRRSIPIFRKSHAQTIKSEPWR